MYAVNLHSALTPGLASLANAARGDALVRTLTPASQIQVEGPAHSAPLNNLPGHPIHSLLAQGPGRTTTRDQGGALNPLLAPSQAEGRKAFADKYVDWWKQYGRDGGEWNKIKTLRVARPENGEDSVSEGTGYGMLLTVHWQDAQARDRFDRLWAYAQKNFNEHGLMAWKIGSDGTPIDTHAATDADEDMAMALVMAFKRWGDPRYKADAIMLINNIMNHEVDQSTNILKPGDYASSEINPSYFAPAYYRVFKALTGDPRWDAVREKSYALLEVARAQGNGALVPDWMDAQGRSVESQNKDHHHDYGYDAMRTPWRFALDAAWYGDQRAINYLKKVNEFFQKDGIQKAWDRYSLDGRPVDQGYNGHNAAAVSMAAIAAIVDDPGSAYRKAVWQEMTVNVPVEYRYYNESLRALSMLFTGNLMEKPVF
jgi:endo-1,4-beta-D-glucanase Y